MHTSTPEDNALLEVATRIGQRTLWQRTLKLQRTTLEDVWAGIEDFARDDWRTPAELSAHLSAWLRAHDPDAGATLDNEAGRYFGFGHGGLVRRPLKGGWQSQGAPGYRTASSVVGDRTAVLADPDASMDALVRRHVASYGPASRHDIAWWAGVGLRVVDASLQRLADELDRRGGSGRPPLPRPGRRSVAPRAARASGCCRSSTPSSAASTRRRDGASSTPEHYRRLWTHGNGMIPALLLVDGRITGEWRIPGAGTRRPCEVTWFAGTRRPTKAELAGPVSDLEAAYGIRSRSSRSRAAEALPARGVGAPDEGALEPGTMAAWSRAGPRWSRTAGPAPSGPSTRSVPT